MDKIWLPQYQAGVPAEINPSEYRSLLELMEQSITRFRDRPCFTCMERTLTYGDIDVLATRFAAYLQKVARLRHGRPHRDHAAEHPAVPGRDPRRIPRRPHGRQHQPDVHAARTAAPAARLGRARHPDPREFRAHARRGPRPRRGRHGHRHGRRRPARLPEVGAGQFRAAPRAQAGAGMEPAGLGGVHRGPEPGTLREPRADAASATRTSRSCSTRAARPAFPRAPC